MVLTAVIYAPTVNYPYVYEDKNDPSAFSRPWPVASPDVIGDALRHPTRMLRDVSFALGGTAPRQAHAGNVALHLANGLLVYALAATLMSTGGAVFAAAVFWLHPVQVESVAYISSRADLVAALFLLLALVTYERVWLSLLCAVFAVLAKETFVMALLIPLVSAGLTRRRVPAWAALVIAAAVVAFGMAMFGVRVHAMAALQLLAQVTHLLTLWVVPYPLTVDHAWPIWSGVVLSSVVVAWGSLAWLAWRWGCPRWSWALLAVVVWFLPRAFVPMSEGLHEHHLYAPAIALSLWVGSLVKG